MAVLYRYDAALEQFVPTTGGPGGKGDPGAPGTNGTNGWTPIFSIVTDGARRVLQVVDWTGGTGTKPATGQYVSATGLTTTLSSAVDIRGPQGATGTAPTNMVTTDSAQAIPLAAAKTFAVGALLMSDGTRSVEPYSDVNAPQSLERTLWPGPSAADTPVAGKAWEWTPDGKSLWMEAPDGTHTKIGPATASGAAGPQVDLTQDWVETTPAAPAVGLTVFARHRTRRLLASIGPSGQDTAYQPALFANRIARLGVVQNTATQTLDGLAVTNLNGPTAVNNSVSPTTFFSSMVRQRYATTTTAGVGAGTRSATTQWHTSTVANKGGFFFVCRFGLNQAVAAGRGFIGLAALIGTAPATAVYSATINPSTQINQIGFGWDQTFNTLRFIPNGATANTASHVDLGANFPVNGGTGASATWYYEVRLFAPSGGGQSVRWSATRLNDGVFAQGQTTTGLPANEVFMGAHVHVSNGATAAVSSIDLQSLYIETDN